MKLNFILKSHTANFYLDLYSSYKDLLTEMETELKVGVLVLALVK